MKSNYKLIIISSGPSQCLKEHLGLLSNKLLSQDYNLIVYLKGEGVLWLNEPHWAEFYHPGIMYYADIDAVYQLQPAFQSEAIFSGKTAMEQLLRHSDDIIEVDETTVCQMLSL